MSTDLIDLGLRRPCYAHTADGPPESDWEPLEEHLRLVAEGDGAAFPGARGFADAFGAGDLAAAAAWWHDLGKYSDAFQDYLLEQRGIERANAHVERAGRVDHSTAGAQHAAKLGGLGELLAACIAGHHGGMPDTEGDASLALRLIKQIPPPVHAPSAVLNGAIPAPPVLTPEHSGPAFQVAFLMRMVFSALVDADFIATELFMKPSLARERLAGKRPQVAELSRSLDRHLDELARTSAASSAVNQSRASVLEACRRESARNQGFFTLTVPTGGGKTFSSLAFALRHAEEHGLRRVIFAVPYTSIIEQNAEEFRKALSEAGEQAVLEHHSTFEPKDEDRWSRLAGEDWDAPVVMTTAVQLYESLFHNRPSKCRKLHNIARSVIVLDEAQSIPVRLLRPTLAALNELVMNYGCTVVLCTATQPAIKRTEEFPIGVPEPTEIIDDVPGLFGALDRVRVEDPREFSDDRLVAALASEHAVLCIVRTKGEARELFPMLREAAGESSVTPLREATCLHLSTDMCPAHRSEVIGIICERLNRGLACRVISTSLIEAGVDVDFPVVYRAVAGLDAIAQAAGRCNRNGRLAEPGRVVLYTQPHRPLKRTMHELSLAIEDTMKVLGRYESVLAPEAIREYFAEHYWRRQQEWDDKRVMECFKAGPRVPMLQYRTAAERYRLIDDELTPVVVPWRERGAELVAQLGALHEPANREMRRACQRFAVGVRPRVLAAFVERGVVAEPPGGTGSGMWYVRHKSVYDDTVGLDLSAQGLAVEDMII